MVTHHQDVYGDEFDALLRGEQKTLQVSRKVHYVPGDVVVIRETDHTGCEATGRKLVLEITHVKASWPENILSVQPPG